MGCFVVVSCLTSSASAIVYFEAVESSATIFFAFNSMTG
jgi:hypothetical protein